MFRGEGERSAHPKYSEGGALPFFGGKRFSAGPCGEADKNSSCVICEKMQKDVYRNAFLRYNEIYKI